MSTSKAKRAVKNVVFSVLVKILTFAVGIIIPRLLIINYGSATNGLLQTAGSVFSYMGLIFAGVGNAGIQGLYKPLANNNRQEISEILVAIRQYFRKLVLWFALCTCGFGLIFPLLTQEELGFGVVAGVILIEGFSLILTYYFTYTMQTLLTADGRDYVIQLIQFVVFLITSAAKILLALLGVHVLILQIAYLLINILQISIYKAYIHKQYPWIDWQANPNHTPLKKRKNYLINGISWTVFHSTDTIVISAFCGLAFTSVYAMYNMVFSNLNLILTFFYSSIYFILGQTYHKNKEAYLSLHDGFESVISAITFSILAAAYVLILPFMRLYTQNIADINYIDAHLPILFCLVQILSNTRMISGNLINLTNNPQLTNKASIIEVTINISLSVLLVNILGIHGVLIGTAVGLLFKTNYIIIVANRKLLNRSPVRTYITLAANCLLFAVVAIVSGYVDLGIDNYVKFLAVGAVVTVLLIAAFFGVNFIANPAAMKQCLRMLKGDKSAA